MFRVLVFLLATHLSFIHAQLNDSVVLPDRWVLTLEDEFEGTKEGYRKQTEDPRFEVTRCYDHVIPICNVTNFEGVLCPEYQEQLKELNKCLWRAWYYPNYMDHTNVIYDGKPGINAFHPSMISISPDEILPPEKASAPAVQKGALYLNVAFQEAGDSGYQCHWPSNEETAQMSIPDYSPFTHCPIISGGIYSQAFFLRDRGDGSQKVVNYSWLNDNQNKPSAPLEKVLGFEQLFGRFEIRAKISRGPTTWPALWLLPQNMWRPRETLIDREGNPSRSGAGWPETGEFDILETWGSDPNKIIMTYGGGEMYEERQVQQFWRWNKTLATASEEFHVYALEWSENRIRYLIDDELIGEAYQDEKGHRNRKPANGSKHIDIPNDDPFYLLLNLTMSPNSQEEMKNVWNDHFNNYNLPYLRDIAKNSTPLVIDYVRAYRPCLAKDYQENASRCVLKKIYYAGHDSNTTKPAEAGMTASLFPNPVAPGGNVQLTVTPHQNCQTLQYYLMPLASGQILLEETKNPIDGFKENELYTFETTLSPGIDAGAYHFYVRLSKCTSPQGNSMPDGDHSFKLIVQ